MVFHNDASVLECCLCLYCHNIDRIVESSVLSSAEVFKQMIPPEEKHLKKKHFLKKILCSDPSRECFMRSCGTCRDKADDLEIEMMQMFQDGNISEISFEVWETTERCKVVPRCETSRDFIEMFVRKIVKYSSHLYEYTTQQKFYDDLTKTLPQNQVLIAGDFAENLSFFEAKEIQSAYYGKSQATIFPTIVFYNKHGNIQKFSAIFISDTLHHRAQEVYAFLNVLNRHLDEFFGERAHNIYFSDGAGSHFKCRSNFINVAHHHLDYGCTAEWHFQGTSHGKGQINCFLAADSSSIVPNVVCLFVKLNQLEKLEAAKAA